MPRDIHPIPVWRKSIHCITSIPKEFSAIRRSARTQSICKTATLECFGLLGAMCSDPLRFAEKEVLFHIDNVASVYALSKGHSRDEWATTIVRAACVVASGIGCSLYSEWERRRSTRESCIADDLTHNLVGSLDNKELQAYLSAGKVEFPEPILEWMAKPERDQSLGARILLWLRNEFVGLKIIRPIE